MVAAATVRMPRLHLKLTYLDPQNNEMVLLEEQQFRVNDITRSIICYWAHCRHWNMQKETKHPNTNESIKIGSGNCRLWNGTFEHVAS